jgi:hypothetical protein
MVRDLQWDTLYHEHPHVHTAKSLRVLLESAEFGLVEVIETPLHQGSLRILARKGADSAPPNAVELREHKEFPEYLKRCKAFGALATHSMQELRRSLPQGSWAYGAGARAVMWINAADLVHSIETVVDMSPLRYNTFIPGTRIPVVPPSVFRNSRPPAVLITAWNYQNQVRRQEPQYPGPWMVPLPVLTRIS